MRGWPVVTSIALVEWLRRRRSSAADLQKQLDRRTRELTDALEQQAATSEILRVISSSPSDLQPVFETIARSAVDLCGATYGMVFRYDGELLSVVAHYNLDQAALDAYQRIWPMRPDNRTVTGQTVLERKVVHVPDVEREPRYTFAAAYRASLGIRTYLGVPSNRQTLRRCSKPNLEIHGEFFRIGRKSRRFGTAGVLRELGSQAVQGTSVDRDYEGKRGSGRGAVLVYDASQRSWLQVSAVGPRAWPMVTLAVHGD